MALPLSERLAQLEHDSLLRTRRVVRARPGATFETAAGPLADFASNDYLGLAQDARLVAAAREALQSHGLGAGASPMVCGHGPLHEAAERRFARFCGLERALLFASGYAANLGILQSLAGRSAEIFLDRLDHACLVDGAVLSRAKLTRYPHLDLAALQVRLQASKAATRIVATDTVFSMDGDVAPLAQMLALCERHDAWLVLDDAHGCGVLGKRGHGALEAFGLCSPRLVYMATLGKALGGYGAFVAGSGEMVEWILQRARTYVFSTGLPPLLAAAAVAAMDVIDADPALVSSLHERIARFRRRCGERGIPVTPSTTAIQPVLLGTARRALEVSAALASRGFAVPAIRPPTVPEGTSRLRVSLSAAHSAKQVEDLCDALADCLQ